VVEEPRSSDRETEGTEGGPEEIRRRFVSTNDHELEEYRADAIRKLVGGTVSEVMLIPKFFFYWNQKSGTCLQSR
jgi:hypothetical protein